MGTAASPIQQNFQRFYFLVINIQARVKNLKCHD